MNAIELHTPQIIQLCETHKVKALYLFGSALSNRFTDASDIDLLIQFAEVELLDYFDNYMDLKEELEKLFNRPVDLIENQAIKNPVFRQNIDKDKKLLYERASA